MPDYFQPHTHWSAQTLSPQTVALWYLADQPGFDEAVGCAVMSRSELDRADHFKAAGKRREYILGRWFVRHILGQYLNLAPAQVGIQWVPGQKPQLTHAGWHFNLSHSHGGIACLVSPAYPVGVDIEYTGRRVLKLDYAHAFTAYERQMHQALAPAQAKTHFFLRWTMKEALWKGINSPVYIPFNGFEIQFSPFQIKGLDPAWPERPRAVRWLHPAPGYLIAADVEGAAEEQIDWQFHTFVLPAAKSTL